MSPTRSLLLVAAFVVVVLGCLGGASYLVLEVMACRGVVAVLGIVCMLAVGLGPCLVWFVRRARAGRAPSAATVGLDAAADERRRRIERRVAELRGDVRRERWIPLVESGRLVSDEQLAGWNARIEQLEAVPHRRPYVADLLRGVDYSDEQIDYLESPDRLLTCEHLRGVEHALRRSGQRTLPVGPLRVWVGCQLAFAAVRERCAVPPFVETIDVVVDARDNLVDHRLRCPQCNSEIVGLSGGVVWSG